MFREYSRWLPYIVDLFLPICNSENGDFMTMPFDGSLAEQPYMTMQILLLIQNNFKQMLSEKVEKMKAKAAAGRRYRRRR